MSSDCNGCISRIIIAGVNECLHTVTGIKDLLDCPCKKCLIKIMCKDGCENFRINKNKKINQGRYLFGANYSGPRVMTHQLKEDEQDYDR